MQSKLRANIELALQAVVAVAIVAIAAD